MLLTYFTEQPLSTYPEPQALVHQDDDHPARAPGDTVLLFSNKYFDPVDASRLYNERLEEYRLAEEVGFDAIMFNEHHNAAFCMQACCNIMTAAVATITKRVKLLQAGNPLPIWDNPVQLAEETAMLDLISRGRLIAGIVRGGGAEQLSNNANPAFNRERFQEAHDLLVKAWTVPGPWRWEGEHYQFRVVNPWVRPLQQPHPRIVVPGVTSPETIVWAAQHAYPYLVLNSTLEQTKQIWALYDRVAAESGYQAGPEHRGYLMRCHVQPSGEKAVANARNFTWMLGEFTGIANPVWNAPTGYSSWDARVARRAVYKSAGASVEEQIRGLTLIAGTPKQVIQTIRIWMEETRPGILIFWSNDGRIDHANSSTCIRLLGEEVLPAVREIGKELGLVGPFDINAPVSLTAGPARPLPAVPVPVGAG